MRIGVLGTGMVGIAAARGTEMYLPLWLSLYGALGRGHFNIDVVR